MVNKKESAVKSHHREEESPLTLFNIDDYSINDPAAGYRNGSSLNNAGENGNYWSSTPNESNSNNAYNLNFNSDNHNVNWNNRNNGQSVRPVSELTSESSHKVRHFSISKEQLLLDLYRAYKDARKNKRSRAYQLKFEFNLEENLVNLRDELISGIYKPLPSNCFIIHDPKMREVFAANFRDRIVHHLFYNYTHEIFEKTFIYDTYSCIKNRGTHFGIGRLKHHILSVSKGYSKPCYILKIDIKGYFMNINRSILLKLCRNTLSKCRKQLQDYIFVDYLLETIINTNPIENCNVLGKVEDWDNLPNEKSLLAANRNCGLPIGNLSSQLFSNVYMNVFDQYVKRQLKCRHYGRYVDDAYIVSNDRNLLKKIISEIVNFLNSELGLRININKTRIYDAYHGIEFLGAYIKPFRTYISSSSLKRIKRKVNKCDIRNRKRLQSSVNSFLGVFSHYNSYCMRRVLFGNNDKLNHNGYINNDFLIFSLRRDM